MEGLCFWLAVGQRPPSSPWLVGLTRMAAGFIGPEGTKFTSRMEVAILCSLIPEEQAHHLCHDPLVRSKSRGGDC